MNFLRQLIPQLRLLWQGDVAPASRAYGSSRELHNPVGCLTSWFYPTPFRKMPFVSIDTLRGVKGPPPSCQPGIYQFPGRHDGRLMPVFYIRPERNGFARECLAGDGGAFAGRGACFTPPGMAFAVRPRLACPFDPVIGELANRNTRLL